MNYENEEQYNADMEAQAQHDAEQEANEAQAEAEHEQLIFDAEQVEEIKAKATAINEQLNQPELTPLEHTLHQLEDVKGTIKNELTKCGGEPEKHLISALQNIGTLIYFIERSIEESKKLNP